MLSVDPKVCVGIACFNQARYIREALDSALGQKTDFPSEIVVHDDAPTTAPRERSGVRRNSSAATTFTPIRAAAKLIRAFRRRSDRTWAPSG